MLKILWFAKNVFNKKIPFGIKMLILKGYKNLDFSPRKCHKCKCKSFHKGFVYYSDYYADEYELLCDKCNERVGLWSYGAWYE